MTTSSDTIYSNNEYSDGLPEFIITESGQKLLNTIEENLKSLVCRTDLLPWDDEFYFAFCNFLDMYSMLQLEVICASGVNIVCGSGCSICCCHWVEDVSSAEGAVLARYIQENHPEMTGPIINSFRKDSEALDSLCEIVENKIAGYSSDSGENPDQYDLLLSCFYQLERQCALLDDKGRCTVYPVRPLSCRDYINLRDTLACLPDRINNEKHATLLMHLSDTITELMEILHRRFDDGSDDTSLRSLLVRFLEPGGKY